MTNHQPWNIIASFDEEAPFTFLRWFFCVNRWKFFWCFRYLIEVFDDALEGVDLVEVADHH